MNNNEIQSVENNKSVFLDCHFMYLDFRCFFAHFFKKLLWPLVVLFALFFYLWFSLVVLFPIFIWPLEVLFAHFFLYF